MVAIFSVHAKSVLALNLSIILFHPNTVDACLFMMGYGKCGASIKDSNNAMEYKVGHSTELCFER